jgi:hypothetical protein
VHIIHHKAQELVPFPRFQPVLNRHKNCHNHSIRFYQR